MSGWIYAIGLGVISFAVMAWLFRLPRQGWAATGAALLFGLAGYGLQGSQAQPGAPRDAAEEQSAKAAPTPPDKSPDLVQDKFLITANAFLRHGQFADAAGVLRAGAKKEPGNGEIWLAMANALVQHAEGNLSPAAIYAFNRAAQIDPRNPGPPFFLGLALAQSGRFSEGRMLWADLLARSPADAPWRADLTARLAELDAFIARQQGSATNP
jgi:cytochrome c-type biogenesis protein CcmH